MADAPEFPDDLLQLQRDWYAAEAAWAADPSEENRSAFAAAGERLRQHPYWAAAEHGHKARMALKKAARPDAG